jgi:hypothetical protein
MKNRYRRRWFRSLLVAAVLLSILLLPANWWNPKHAAIADFAAPMPASAAEAIVAAARQGQRVHGDVLATETSTPAPSQPPAIETVYFAQSGHHLGDGSGFLRFWRMHGGVLILGYPISEEIEEGGRIVQYFERVRFEFHAEQQNPEFRIQLGLLGAQLTKGRDFPQAAPGSGEQFFPETGHGLSGPFYDFWRKHGGLPVFGYPISEPLQEAGAADGKPYTVQYFERARFEHHPEDMEAFYRDRANKKGLRLLTLYEVQLGDLGRQVAARQGYHFARSEQRPEAPTWSPGLWSRRIEVNLTTQWLTAYEDDTPVFQAPVATARDGFVTPTGSFAIYRKTPKRTMAGALGGERWYVPNVPWVQYVVGGVALHGTYWHDKWGTGFRLSHGCINLNIDDAQWLYDWASIGTSVHIFRS